MNWQPIATAPKDQRILLFFPKMPGKGFEAHIQTGTGFVPEAQWWRPTHWMPLPPPPEAA